jgi:guanylate kinase
MICILGCSASGKSTIEEELTKYGYSKIISYTTRPIREGEENHKNYHFITKEKFIELKEDNFFGESTQYNSWFYGIAKEDMRSDAVAVIESFGFRQIQKLAEGEGFKITSFFIDAPERVRLKRMVDRGDNLMEIFRRIFSDQGVFQGVEEEATYVINNDRPLQETIEEIITILNK